MVKPARAQAQTQTQPPPTPPAPTFRQTDVGNAERLVARHGHEMRWCNPHKTWYVWDGKRWAKDQTLQAERWAIDVIREMYAEAALIADAGDRQALVDFAQESERIERIRGLLSVAKSKLSAVPSDFDADPWLLNCQNGIVDLLHGNLLPHDPQQMCSKITGANFDPKAKCPTWHAFMDKILPDPEVRLFIQRAAGYSLAGTGRDHAILVLWGEGRNGKSVLKEILLKAAGDYAMNATSDTFLTKKPGTINNDIARLAGVRMVTASETEAGRRLAVATVKQMTGSDTITARFLHAENFDFIPVFTPWMATNHKPIIPDGSDPIWDRVKLVEFGVRFWKPDDDAPHPPGFEADTTLLDKLLIELDGILSWMVQGCFTWQRHGLGTPPAVVQATREYRNEMDNIARFLGEYEDARPGSKIAKMQVYGAYAAWCEQQEERPQRQAEFNRLLVKRGWVERRLTGGKFGWIVPAPDEVSGSVSEVVNPSEAENSNVILSNAQTDNPENGFTALHSFTTSSTDPVLNKRLLRKSRTQQ